MSRESPYRIDRRVAGMRDWHVRFLAVSADPVTVRATTRERATELARSMTGHSGDAFVWGDEDGPQLVPPPREWMLAEAARLRQQAERWELRATQPPPTAALEAPSAA